MLYLTCTTKTSVDLAHNGVSRAKDWVSVDCGTSIVMAPKMKIVEFENSVGVDEALYCFSSSP